MLWGISLELLEGAQEGSKQPLGALLLRRIDRTVLCRPLPGLHEILQQQLASINTC